MQKYEPTILQSGGLCQGEFKGLPVMGPGCPGNGKKARKDGKKVGLQVAETRPGV